jgi:HK97 family phage prohead protease
MKLTLSAGFAIDVEAAAGEAPTRTISGMAVPYGVSAIVQDGTTVEFAPGSLPIDGKAPKLFMYHDSTQPVGILTSRNESPDGSGMLFQAKIVATPAGDAALQMAKEGVLDSVSVGIDVAESYRKEDGTMVITSAIWRELSLVPIPAFSGATITDVAASADTSPDEIPVITPQVEETKMSEIIEAAAPEAAPSAPTIWAQPKKSFAMPSAAEYMAAMHAGGDTWVRVNRAFKENLLEKSSAYEFALAQDLTTDTAGLLEQRLLGPVIQDLNFMRPTVTALGVSAMPSTPSKTFTRTKISQHTSVSTQTEGAAVSSTKMTLSANTVTKSTQAGGVFISQQDIDFTAIPALQTIINDLTGEYMIRTDDVASDALVAAATASGSTWTFNQVDPSTLVDALYDAAREMAEDTNYFPTHIYCSTNVWEKLGRQLDADKRPLFGYVGANNNIVTNGLGGSTGLNYNSMNPLGLEVVVSNNFAAGTMIVAHTPKGSPTSAFSFYEDIRGIMSNEDAELLGRNVTFYGYIATFANIPVCLQSITIA